MKVEICKRLVAIYGDVRATFGAFDYNGTGCITLSAFVGHRDIKRMAPLYTSDEIKEWLFRDKVFERPKPGESEPTIDFQTFKRHFFPQVVRTRDTDVVRGSPGSRER